MENGRWEGGGGGTWTADRELGLWSEMLVMQMLAGVV